MKASDAAAALALVEPQEQAHERFDSVGSHPAARGHP
jgi:hypothetical protein